MDTDEMLSLWKSKHIYAGTGCRVSLGWTECTAAVGWTGCRGWTGFLAPPALQAYRVGHTSLTT